MKILKKILIICVIATLILLPNKILFADDEDEDELNHEELHEAMESATLPTNEPVINARAAIIYDRATGKTIWGKNENQKRAMASTTKIMTALVVLENCKITDTVTISKKAAGIGGSTLKIKAGDKITVNDLLYGLMLRSRKRRCSCSCGICWRKCRRLCQLNEQKSRRNWVKRYSLCNTTWVRQ